MGYSKECLDIVDIVTNDAEDGQFDYQAKTDAIIHSNNDGAILVKYADMSENNDPKRLANLPQDTRERLEKKYEIALKKLNVKVEEIEQRYKKAKANSA